MSIILSSVSRNTYEQAKKANNIVYISITGSLNDDYSDYKRNPTTEFTSPRMWAANGHKITLPIGRRTEKQLRDRAKSD